MKRSVRVLWLCGILCCCGFNASVRPFDEGGRRCVAAEDAARARGWRMTVAPEGAVMTLESRGFAVRLQSGSAAAQVNGIRFALLGPVVRRDPGLWLIGRADLEQSLSPFLDGGAIPPTPVKRIVIDPGHGGSDPGAERAGIQEKTVNLAVASRLAALLEQKGLEVVMTRTGDESRSLASRADRVRIDNADLYISIHQNSAKNTRAAGMEVYFSAKNRYAKASLRLAYEVQRSALEQLGAKPGNAYDRGIKRADFRVTRSADCPAILLECAFISNASDRALMTLDAYLDELAHGIADGIEAYIEAAADEEEDR